MIMDAIANLSLGHRKAFLEKPAFCAHFTPFVTEFSALVTTWRREVDSNPGYAFCNLLLHLVQPHRDQILTTHGVR
jgi:hypothetical protein